MLKVMLATLDILDAQIGDLDKEISRRSREDAVARRFMTIPGIGPITAVALAALAPPLEGFRKGRDFAAWLGLTPRQMSTGGKPKLGSITKMGDRTLRRLLIIGSTAVIRQARRTGAMPSLWLKQMLERKPPMLVAVALANKMARMVWAVTTRNEDYRAPVMATNSRDCEGVVSVVERRRVWRNSRSAGPENQDLPPCRAHALMM
jgi:transposase